MATFSNFTGLFNKYLENKCSEEEVEHLLSLLKTDEYRKYANELILDQTSRPTQTQPANTELKERLENRLKFILENETSSSAPVVKGSFLRSISMWKAAAVVLILLSAGVYFFNQQNKSISFASRNSATMYPLTETPYSRYITLPDGSAVVLHSGSKLLYPQKFTGSVREVVLTGEAYFDIVHDARKPFIIHTGKVRTTVLGTAFNIKADGSKVVVSVTRGKVRVEDDSKILGVITHDQQIRYSVPAAVAEQQTVNANIVVTDWTKQDMVFSGISFSEIAEILTRRYSVPVKFKNEALKSCKIMASFSGTETLDQVASVLSGIRNGTYETDESGTLWIDGETCE